MKKLFPLLLSIVALTSCSTPADHFDRVWNLDSKLLTFTLKAFNSSSDSSFHVALRNIDGVVASLNQIEEFGENDSLIYFVHESALFTSRLLHTYGDSLVDDSRVKDVVKRIYLDSSGVLNKRINFAAIRFLNEYDLNVAVQ